MRFIRTVTVSAPASAVFLHLDDGGRRKQWLPALADVSYEKPGVPRGVGTQFIQRIRRRGRVREYAGEITAYRPPHELGFRLEAARFAIDIVYRLAARPGGTRVEQVCTTTAKNALARALAMIGASPLRWQQRPMLARLKAAVEQAQVHESRA